MKLTTVYARFYKSFNFDHHRKAHDEAKARPWEMIGEAWYPYIEVAIHDRITTVVGANESGKSHLLSAIEKAISGDGFRHQDLCRYCDFFNVERGNDFWPNLGVGWSDVTEEEGGFIRAEVDGAPDRFNCFLMFREGPDALNLYFPKEDGGFQHARLEAKDAHSFGKTFLPRPFRIHSNVALPGALPFSEIAAPAGGPNHSRAQRNGLMELGEAVRGGWNGNAETFTQALPQLAPKLVKYLATLDEAAGQSSTARQLSFDLARKLLVQLGNVDPKRLNELPDFLAVSEDGHVAALATSINEQLEKKLNFPKFWVQDRDFQLLVTPHEAELVFTIQDRTGTQYTFDERSAGLQYFLSYFIQSQTHQPDPDRSEILLMDEPDAYLSAEAQQDLLKIFGEFAQPQSDARPIQVVYVTHSPFLLDKNHADRIRVLQKGKGSDGTRVIKNASQNHYEPLRSAIGAYVGETAFIGACNLLVEGVADQVLLAGMSRLIQRDGPVGEGELLDLNRLVLVPCGSASHVPYMLYLIRGRDADAPPVIVLLDSDKSGSDAAAELRKNDMRRLIKLEFVMQFADFKLAPEEKHAMLEPEDLVPLPLAVAATNRYFMQVSQFRTGQPPNFDLKAVRTKLTAKVGVFDALKGVAAETGDHIDKIGFARAVVELCAERPSQPKLDAEIDLFKARMRKLFSELNRRRRKAEQDRYRDRASAKVEQQRKIFIRDHAETATKEQALFLFERIQDGLEESLDADAINGEILSLKRRHELDGEALDPVPNYPAFLARLKTLKDAFELHGGTPPQDKAQDGDDPTKAPGPDRGAVRKRRPARE